MRCLYIILSIQLLNNSVFSNDSFLGLRNTIAEYGHTDKDSDHSYIEPYEMLLSPFKDKACDLLEIGVNYGGSAMMWYNYLPRSHLFLIDNRNVLLPHITSAVDRGRWHFYLGDAYTIEMTAIMRQECPTGFDLIIDDGPHSLESQKFVITAYLPLLKKGGILVIEDIPCIGDVEILKESVPSSSEFQVEIIDLRDVKGRYDDILFVVKKIE